jgi:hypothetical protein
MPYLCHVSIQRQRSRNIIVEAVRERRTIVTVLVDVTQTRNSGTEPCPRLTLLKDNEAVKRMVLLDILGEKTHFLCSHFVIGTGKLMKGRNLEGKKIPLGNKSECGGKKSNGKLEIFAPVRRVSKLSF